MNILLASLLTRSVSPQITASRPRVIYELAKGLLAKGHTVAILGTGDSQVPGAKIIPVIPQGFRSLPAYENPFYAETGFLVKMAKSIEQVADRFDVIHNHTYPEFINLLAADTIRTPMVTTVHAQAAPELDEVLSLFPESYLVAMSHAHKRLFQRARINTVVYNGVDTALYALREQKDDYLLWIGRLSKAKQHDGTFMDPKGVKWAIQLAQATGEKLLLSGNVEDQAFFDEEVKPHLSDQIQWVGEVSPEQPLSKEEVVTLMQGAKAFLMTINWEEPFGLVMAEAMSCGTPVIGFDRGSVPELVVDEKTGFVVPPDAGVEGLAQAVSRLGSIDPKACRAHVEAKFSLDTMVAAYEQVYRSVITQKGAR